MKDQILKIAGVKSEKEFYKKFPTEESFMAKHGKKLEKLAMGKSMVNKQLKQLTDFGNPPIAEDGVDATPKFGFTNNVKADGLGATAGAAGMGLLQNAGAIIGGFSAMGQQKKNIKNAQMSQTISGLGLEAAAGARRNQPKNQYVRPEDNLVQPDQLGSAQGTGTNFLQMKEGGEIQNTYAPGTLYDNLEEIPRAEFGEFFQDSGQAQVGGAAGEALGSAFFGPAGGAVGKIVGQVAGNLLGGAKDARKLKAAQDATLMNQQQTAMQSVMQNQFGANMKQGGWVSNDWQPQVITKFGEYSTKDLLKPDPMMDTLRSGGHLAQVNYTPPSARALETAVDGTVLDSAIRSKTDLQSTDDNGRFTQNLRHAISSTDTYADGRPIEKTDLYSITKGRGDNQRVKEFLKTQVGDAAPQYSMQKTYKPLFSDQYKTVSKNIGAGRGERRMADMENFLAEGKMEDGGYMAMGGALQTHWGGDAELMSYNPYIPGGGETVMFRGQSHDDTNEKGQSGIGITYGSNPVEVERGEPMTEMNGGGVVFGNMMMPGGKQKFKNYAADLSKTEAKQNKIMDKASKLALDADENDPFGRLTLNSSEASLIGANMKLKDIAQKKQDAADLQSAILDTADEMGLVADDLAKGKIKKSKTSMKEAQSGKFIQGPLTDAQIKAAQGPGGTLYEGAKHYVTERGQLPLFARMLGAKPKPQYFNPELNNTLMNADDRSYLLDSKYNSNLSNNLLYGTRNYSTYNPDLTSALMYGTPYTQQTITPLQTTGVVTETTDGNQVVNSTSNIKTTETGTGKSGKTSTSKSSGKNITPKASTTYIAPTPVNLTDNRGTNYNWQVNESPFPRPTGIVPTSPDYAMPEGMATSNITGVDIFGNYTGPNEAFASDTKKGTRVGNALRFLKKGFEKYGETALSNLAPFLRPTDQEGLDPAQLMGEQYALAMNQLEPVQAQKYQPQLGGIMDLSYQDQLNEITAQARAAERMMQNNPEAAANLFAQVAQAKSKVLAEQTRANMLGRKQVYDENRNLLNQAQLQNLQILDQQYERQSKAKSNTKAQAQAALNSIADKIAKNKLENRQLGIMENMYNYRFDPMGRAINMNAPAKINLSGKGGGTGKYVAPPGFEYLYDAAGNVKKMDPVKKDGGKIKALNGSIVKATKLKNI